MFICREGSICESKDGLCPIRFGNNVIWIPTGPTALNFFINNLPCCLNSRRIILLADDAAFCCSAKCVNNVMKSNH